MSSRPERLTYTEEVERSSYQASVSSSVRLDSHLTEEEQNFAQSDRESRLREEEQLVELDDY